MLVHEQLSDKSTKGSVQEANQQVHLDHLPKQNISVVSFGMFSGWPSGPPH